MQIKQRQRLDWVCSRIGNSSGRWQSTDCFRLAIALLAFGLLSAPSNARAQQFVQPGANGANTSGNRFGGADTNATPPFGQNAPGNDNTQDLFSNREVSPGAGADTTAANTTTVSKVTTNATSDATSDAATDAAAEEDASAAANSKAGSVSNWARSLVAAIRGAGPMMFPILGCSILLVMFVLERSIALRRRRVIPKHFTKLFLNELEEGQLKPLEALQLCEENKSPISEVFAAAVKKWNKPSVEVEQTVIDAGERVANGLRRYLRLFNGIATIAPLLGLLGTVLGMIEAFNAIASSDAMGRPELLAKGISQALLTTAGGLSVAIPAFIAYMYFTSRVDRLIIEIDGLGQQVVNAIASDAWKSKSNRKSKQTSKAA